MTNAEAMDKMIELMDEYGWATEKDFEKFIKEIEGTSSYWKLMAKLLHSNLELQREVRSLKDKSDKAESILERMGESFRAKTEYGW
jgi:hypothetical protein